MPKHDWSRIIDTLHTHLRTGPDTAVSSDRQRPFRVLVATLISLRTKDEVTAPAAERLLERAGTPGELMQLGVEQIQELIYPAGFYRVKAKNLKEIARIIAVTCGGTVPHGMDALLALPGVGRKTANLVRNLGFGLLGICVDTHVHRISNRTGWVCTKNPNQTEKALEQVLPKKYWVSINGLLVGFGKSVCTPVSPFCSRCPLPFSCPRVGVARMR